MTSVVTAAALLADLLVSRRAEGVADWEVATDARGELRVRDAGGSWWVVRRERGRVVLR